MSTTNRSLRSGEWFGAQGRNGFIHRSWMRNQGFADGRLRRPPGDRHRQQLVRADALQRPPARPGRTGEARRLAERRPAAGVPGDVPGRDRSCAPTTMLYRNLMAMELEETVRANPLDGVRPAVRLRQDHPGLLMGAASVDLPSLMITGGPMLNGKFRGQDIGSGTVVWRFTEEMRAGRMTEADLRRGGGLHGPQPGPLHDHGYGVHHGLRRPRCWACSCRAAPPCRRSTPGGRAGQAAGARGSSRWSRRTCGRRACSPGRRSRTPSGSTPRSAAPPTPSCTCWRSPAASASRCRSTTSTPSPRDVPTLVDLMPSGRSSWRTSPTRVACRSC